MKKLKITEKYAQEFDEKCARSDSHGFLRFLTEPDEHNVSLLDLIAQVEDVIKFNPSERDTDFELNEQTISNCMNKFFSRYMPQKADQVKQILNKTHPYFIDRDGGTHVNFIPAKAGDSHSSNVGHSGRRSFLEFNVYMHNSLEDLRTTAHELSHALSSHHQHLIEMLRSGASMEEIDKFTHKGFENDCVGEVESHITERLFNRFLVKEGLYTKKDLENYENGQQASLLSEINLIREERDIIKNLSCPVSYESLDKLVKNLQQNHNDRLLERVEKMHDDPKSSGYMFRYVVGRIVADQWMKKFDKVDKQTQKNMLDNFQQFLDKTAELDLNGACENLLDQNFPCVVEDYVMDKVNEKKKGYEPADLSQFTRQDDIEMER